MGSTYVGAWEGGRIRKTRRGPAYVIDLMRGGKRFLITLRATSLEDARVELALFNRDPKAYARALEPEEATSPVGVNPELVQAFLEHLKAEGRSKVYRANARNYLGWWAEVLDGEDFRTGTIELKDLHRHLDKAGTARRHRIIAFKSYCSWLVGRGEIKPAQDPTLALKVPQGRAAKSVRKKLVNLDHLRRVYAMVEEQVVRDILRVRINTGMHHTELVRLAEGGVITELEGFGEIAGTLKFWHKADRPHTNSVEASTLAAAKRLKARGSLPDNKRIDRVLLEAAQAAQVPPIEQGAFRHTFITTGKSKGREVRPPEGGVPLAVMAGAVGHASMETTKKHYDQSDVPSMVLIPVKLHHPADPALLQRKATDESSR